VTTATLSEMSATTQCTGTLSLRDKGWHAMLAQTEFGDYNDNFSAYLIMRYAMNNGYHEEGLRVIKRLRQQILKSEEAKSNEWLLPKLNSYLQAID
jgi:hypothetical protein